MTDDELRPINPFALLAAYAAAALRPRRRRKRGRHQAGGGNTGRMRRDPDGSLSYSPAAYLPPSAPLDDAERRLANAVEVPPPVIGSTPDPRDNLRAAGILPADDTRKDT